MSSRKGGKKSFKPQQVQQSSKQSTQTTEAPNPLLQLILDLFEQIIPKVLPSQLKPPNQSVIINCAKNVEKGFFLSIEVISFISFLVHHMLFSLHFCLNCLSFFLKNCIFYFMI
jgi:hypothetical protein